MERVSVSSAEVQGNGTSGYSSDITPDGRFVTFSSIATNLHPDDTDVTNDVYVRDRLLGTTTLVSRAAGVSGAKGNGHSVRSSISDSGRFVAFDSAATNLNAADVSSQFSIYVRDLVNNTTTLVSRADGPGGASAGGDSFMPSVSSDGRRVAFQSSANNIHASDTDGFTDIFIRDMSSDVNILVSQATGGAKGNGHSSFPSISSDGYYVAFSSFASNLHADDSVVDSDVYVRETFSNATFLISRANGASGARGNSNDEWPDISADGRFVAFSSGSNNLHPDDNPGFSDIFVRDRLTDTTVLASRATGGSGAAGNNNSSFPPGISPDGRYVAFTSAATNLDPQPTVVTNNLFIRDLQEMHTVRADLTADNEQAEGSGSYEPVMADDGVIVFETDANNLVSPDDNWQRDVVLREADLDGDGILEPQDNCPSAANPLQENSDFDPNGDACDSDDDDDGLTDFNDGCPTISEDPDGFEDSDGCWDIDNDQDGICDWGFSFVLESFLCGGSQGTPGPADRGKMAFFPPGHSHGNPADVTCSNLPEDFDAFKDSDGCPEPDNDNDGFPDVIDNCPGTGDLAGPDGALGSPQDSNHNGIRDGAEAAFTSDDSQLTFEDYDGVLDGDGCHDSPGDDFDGDGFTDDSEVFTHLTLPYNPDTDADTILDGSDNCPNWINTAQALPAWTVPAQDSDCDGWNRTREQHVGTDPTKHCNGTAALNDEPDAWPTDFNDNRFTTLADVSAFNPTYNKLQNDQGYNQRFDLNTSNSVTLSDVSLMNAFYNKTCN